VRAALVHPRSLRSDLVLHRLDLSAYRSVALARACPRQFQTVINASPAQTQ
jgi:hypothetical protein